MIHFEITQSPDENVTTSFQFYLNQIYIGRSNGTLCIQDPAILASHLMLEVVENDLLIHPQQNVEAYLINGKRSTSVRKIKTGDMISIGQTQFKILSFNESFKLSKKELLSKKLNALVEENSSRLKVIESMNLKSKA